MNRAALSFSTFLSFLSFLAFMTGCSREPASPRSWLGAVTPVATPAAPGARFPNLASAADGQTVVMSWLEPGTGDDFRLRYAEWQRTGRWGTPLEDASGKDWFINWADFPPMTLRATSRDASRRSTDFRCRDPRRRHFPCCAAGTGAAS